MAMSSKIESYALYGATVAIEPRYLILFLTMAAFMSPALLYAQANCQTAAKTKSTALQRLLTWPLKTAENSTQPSPHYKRPWPDADPNCLPTMQPIAGFSCLEYGGDKQYYLYYRKAAEANIDLAALSLARAESLCGHQDFYWTETNEAYQSLAIPYRGAPKQLIALSVDVLCELGH